MSHVKRQLWRAFVCRLEWSTADLLEYACPRGAVSDPASPIEIPSFDETGSNRAIYEPYALIFRDRLSDRFRTRANQK